MGDRAYELKVWKEDPALARRAGYKPPSRTELEPFAVDSSDDLPPLGSVREKLAAMKSPFARFKASAAAAKKHHGPELSGPAVYERKRNGP
jgi:hypothetical protein